MRCELCPSTEGVFKHTNKGGWCHFVCALFVPGVKFLDRYELETVSLDNVAINNFNKVCSICEKNNHLERATAGVCIQCKVAGCQIIFHATCGMAHGLLAEITAPDKAIEYAAYCFLHKQKTVRPNFTVPFSNTTNQYFSIDKKNSEIDVQYLRKNDENEVPSRNIVRKLSSDFGINVSSSSMDLHMPSDLQNDRSTSEVCGGYDPKEEIENINSKNSPCIDQSISSEVIQENIITTGTESAYLPLLTDDYKSPVRLSKRRPVKSRSYYYDVQDNCHEIKLKPKHKVRHGKSRKNFSKVKKSKKISVKIRDVTRGGTKKVGPAMPRSLFSSVDNATGKYKNIRTATSESDSTCKSMEDLLEWQWKETGGVLMSQFEATDIGSLLSYLHDIKHENERLASKYLTLRHRRDHLRAINAKLELQLLPTSSHSTQAHNLSHRDPQYQEPISISIPNLVSQTNLMSYFNSQVQLQMAPNGHYPSSTLRNYQSRPMSQDLISSATSGLDLLYHALQLPEYQPRALYPQDLRCHADNAMKR